MPVELGESGEAIIGDGSVRRFKYVGVLTMSESLPLGGVVGAPSTPDGAVDPTSLLV